MSQYSHETNLILNLIDSEQTNAIPVEVENFSHQMSRAAANSSDAIKQIDKICVALRSPNPNIAYIVAELMEAKELAKDVYSVTHTYFVASESVLAHTRRTTSEVAEQ